MSQKAESIVSSVQAFGPTLMQGDAMATDLAAKASTTIDAPPQVVWDALTYPAAIKAYMFGATVESDWKPGSSITWKGEFQGKKYEDKGMIRRFEPSRVLEYTHYSPLSGEPDLPENYHVVTIELAPQGPGTRVSLTQNGNATADAREHSQKNWEKMLDGLRTYIESR